MNTVLKIAGAYSGNEIGTLTDDHNALHTAKVTELLNKNKFGVVHRPQTQQVSSTRWVSKQRLDGSYKVRLVARGFEQTVSSVGYFIIAGTPKLTTLQGPLTIAAIHGNQVGFGDCHSASYQSPMPSDSDPVCVEPGSTGSTAGLFQNMASQESYVEPAPEGQWDLSKVWLGNKALQGLKISPQAWCIHSTQKINDVS